MQAYKDDSSKTADKFLTDELLKGFPFDIKNFQIDNDSEFMDNFKHDNIKILIFPSRKPKINGNVKKTIDLSKKNIICKIITI